MIFNFNTRPRATPFMKMIIANNQNNNNNNDNNSKELSKELLLYKKNIDEYNIISLGCNCWPSTVIKELGLRQISLPFDWMISNIDGLEKCFKNNFEFFHKDLYLNFDNTRLIDKYNFQFIHDYSDIINWEKEYEEVFAKYQRRITRFLNIMKDSKPIIILTRYLVKDIRLLKKIFE